MEKKVYITPALTTVRVQAKECMMAVSGPEVLNSSANQKVGMDTKDEGDYDLWDEE